MTRLSDYQWDDGGWNCDKHPEAHHSSYHESLIPYRALIHYARAHATSSLSDTLDQASEVFLKRHLFLSLHSKQPIHPKWLKLCYPSYWHYDILSALKILSEGDKISDKRCTAALDLLHEKQLPDGGFPAEVRYYIGTPGRSHSPVHWGGVNKRIMNPWVTLNALYVLKSVQLVEFHI